MAYELSRNFGQVLPPGIFDSGALSGRIINTTFSFLSTGEYIGCKLQSPIAQTSGALTVYFYCTADSGTTSAMNVEIREAAGSGDPDDPDPAGSALGTSGADVDCSGLAGTWVAFTFTALTLAQNQRYFIYTVNNSGTPATDNATFAWRAASDGIPIASPDIFPYIFGSDGFTTDSTTNAAIQCPCVIVFDDETKAGWPYVTTGTADTGTIWRGNRYTPLTDVIISGIKLGATAGVLENGFFRVYQGSTQLRTVTIDFQMANRSGQCRFDPLTLTAGTAYDIVAQPNTSSSIGIEYGAGASPPTDVQGVLYDEWTHVSGATPGSFTEFSNEISVIGVIIDNYVAGAGGGGVKLAGRGGGLAG